MVSATGAPSKDQSPRATLRILMVLLAGFVGVGIAIGSFLMARSAERRHAETEFRRRADLQYSALEVNLQRNLETLETLRAVFEVATNLTRGEFRNLTKDIIALHPEFQVIEWAPRVPGPARASFEEQARRDMPDFEINDRDSTNRKMRAPDRPEYYPLLYVEPLEQNLIIPGFDAAAGKAGAQLVRARDLGAAMISAPVPLPQTNVPGMIVTLPVYDRSDPGTLEERRLHIRGVLRGVFRTEDLMERAWKAVAPARSDTLILDMDAPPTNRFIHFHSARGGRYETVPSEEEFRRETHYPVHATIAGRSWSFLFRPVPDSARSATTLYPYVLLLSGIAFTLILIAYLHTVLRRAEIIERTVHERTASLEKSNALLNREIAERRRTEEDLRDIQSRLLEAQRIGRIGSWLTDLASGTLTWSAEVFRIFGRDPEKFTPTTEAFFASIHSDDRERVREAVRRATTAGEPYDIEHRIVRPEGSQRTVVERAEVVRDSSGKAMRLAGTVQDVTDVKRAEQRLALERNLLETVLESLPDLIFIKDLQGRYIRANSANLRALGAASMDELAGKTDNEFLPAEVASIYVADDMRVLEEGKAMVNREEPLITHGGERRWLLTTKVPFHDAEGKVAGLVGMSRDITERKRQDEERRAMERKFQETQKLESLGVLAGGIAHDFNNLLTGILGNATLARMDLPAQSPIRAYLEQIELSSQRAADLCKQMLAYSGKGRFVIQPLDISALVQETMHLLQLSISKKAVLKLELEKGLPAIMGDATQIQQVVMNLVINASDAIGERSGVIILRTARMRADAAYLADLTGAETLPGGEYVVLEVTDNGSGMTPEIKNRIFEPFFTTKFTGRGLGLAAVLGIVRGHKGALKVYSEAGKGSTFKLLLPAASSPVRERRATTGAPTARATGTLLIVDDEDPVRHVVARMCSKMGFQVLTAKDGRQAIEIYKAKSDDIDVVLLDLTMPEMDGEETFREIRRINTGAYVLLMSGFNEQEAVARFVGKGLAGFVQKPFTPDQLRDKLKTFFSSPSAD